MVAIHKSTFVSYSAEEMYALVNDIESYPEFLRWCRGAEVHNSSDTALTATVALEVGKIKQSFSTENSMRPGREINMRLLEGPFSFLRGTWRFEPIGDKACTVRLNIEFEFKNKLLKLALNKTFNHIMESMVDSFIRRANEVYGARS